MKRCEYCGEGLEPKPNIAGYWIAMTVLHWGTLMFCDKSAHGKHIPREEPTTMPVELL